MKKIIFNLLKELNSDWESVYKAISFKQKPYNTEISDSEMELFENSMCITDEYYSDKFKEMYKPPFMVFNYGNIKLLDKKLFGILGEIKKEDIAKFAPLKQKNFGICLFKENNNDDIINELVDNGFNVVVVTGKMLNDTMKTDKENLVYISENCTKTEIQQLNFIDLNSIRLVVALSDFIWVSNLGEFYVEFAAVGYKIENKTCYALEDSKLTDPKFVSSVLKEVNKFSGLELDLSDIKNLEFIKQFKDVETLIKAVK